MARLRRPRLVFALLALAALCAGIAASVVVRRTELFPYSYLKRLIPSEWRPARAFSAPDAKGRWGEAWQTADLSEAERAELERLAALGYVSGSDPVAGASGVTVHDPDAAFDGLNFLISGHGSVAQLIEMDGRVLHTWARTWAEVWPNRLTSSESHRHQFWRRAQLLGDGSLVALYDHRGLIKIDRDSRLVWAYPGSCHHDIEILDDGSIYTLESEPQRLRRYHPRRPVLIDYVLVLSPDGEPLRRVSVLEAFERSAWAPLLQRAEPGADLLHTNTLEVLDGRHEELHPAFRAGNVLVSLRTLDTVAIIDMTEEVVVWALAGRWATQHQSTLLPSGQLMVFNNLAGEGVSEVLELDPLTQELVWSFKGSPERPFHSGSCGSNQRLPNGNTLITESDRGRAIELTPDGRVVWEYRSPHRAGERDELIATLLELVRLPRSDVEGWLSHED